MSASLAARAVSPALRRPLAAAAVARRSHHSTTLTAAAARRPTCLATTTSLPLRHIHNVRHVRRACHIVPRSTTPTARSNALTAWLLLLSGGTVLALVTVQSSQAHADAPNSTPESVADAFPSTSTEGANLEFQVELDDETSQLQQPGFIRRMWNRLYNFLPESFRSEKAPALPPPLPDMYGRQPRTLVVGWDKVLLASQWTRQHGWRLQARNDAAAFLKRAFESGYEIVLWSSQPQADIEQYTQLPTIGGEVIRHRLYYDQMNLSNFKSVKDLNRLGRDLRRVIVLDYDEKYYWKQPENALIIPPFDGNPRDRHLTDILPVLEKIQKYNVHDVRTIITAYKANASVTASTSTAPTPSYDPFYIHEQLAQSAAEALGTGKLNTDSQQQKANAGQSAGWLTKLTSIFAPHPQPLRRPPQLNGAGNDD